MQAPVRRLLLRWLPRLLVVAVLGAAFLAYLRPGFMLDLANRWLLCM